MGAKCLSISWNGSMPRKAKPDTFRVTGITDGLVNGWYRWWLKSIDKKLHQTLPLKCQEFAKAPHTAAEWAEFLAPHTAIKETERVSQESTKFGRNVHAVVENYLIQSPLPDNLTEREKTCGGYLIDWCKQTGLVPVEIDGKPGVEVALEDKTLGLTGHPDLVAKINDSLFVVDWKTSSDLRRGYILQLSAYAYMLKKQHGIVVNNGVIVRVPSDPNAVPQFQVHQITDLLTKYWPVFKQGLNVFQFYEKKGKWRG